MTTYIAFLRAINVVGKRNVKMAELKKLFEALELEAVSTFIASGNVIFESVSKSTSALEQKIEKHLAKELGYDVATFVRSRKELDAIVAHKAFGTSEDGTVYVMFTASPLPAAVRKKLLALATESDQFHVHKREVYWLCRTNLSDSPLFKGTQLNKTIGVQTTMRNMSTLKKLAAKLTALD